jgi:hypothetical protein
VRQVCSCDPAAQWFAWGRIDASGRFTASTVVTRDGGAATPAVPATVSTGLSGDVVVDSSGGVSGALGAVTLCNNVAVPAQEWATANFTGSCDTALAQRGFTEPPCNDTRRGCSSTAAAPAVGAALVLLGAMRPRRSAACCAPSTEARTLATYAR